MKIHNTSTQKAQNPSRGGSIVHLPTAGTVPVTCLPTTNGEAGFSPFAAPKKDHGGWAERRSKDGEINPL